MIKYYYIPINSLNLNNILSTESISPPSFYEKRGYGFRRFDKIMASPFNNSILAYSHLPLFQISRSDREEYPFYIAVPEVYLKNDLSKFKYRNISIRRIESTIYLDWHECKFIAGNLEEKKKLISSPERSLEAKHADLYLKEIKLVKDLDRNEVFNWDESVLRNLEDTRNIRLECLISDQKLNKVKGFLYGYVCGKLKERPKEITAGKRYFQDFINSFSGLMNDLSTLLKTPKGSVGHLEYIEKEFNELEELEVKIKTLLGPNNRTNFDQLIRKAFKVDDELVEMFQRVRYYDTKETVYTILMEFIKERSKEIQSVDDLLGELIDKARNFLYKSKPKLFSELQQDFDLVRMKGNSWLQSLENTAISENSLEKIPISINSDHTRIEADIPGLSKEENTYLEIVIDELFSRVELSRSDEIAQQRQDIITSVAKLIGKVHRNFESSAERKYLLRLHKSMQTVGVGFKIDEIGNQVLQAFSCFLSRYAELEKFQDFMEKNKYSNYGLAYGIWGATYGYANLSKILIEPLSTNKRALQLIVKYLNSHLLKRKTINDQVDAVPDTMIEEGATEIEWVLNEESPSLGQKTNTQGRSSFEDLLRKNKIFKEKDEWIQGILEVFNEVTVINSQEEGTLFLQSANLARQFTDLLKQKSSSLKGFGPAKVKEAKSIFERYIQEHEFIN